MMRHQRLCCLSIALEKLDSEAFTQAPSHENFEKLLLEGSNIQHPSSRQFSLSQKNSDFLVSQSWERAFATGKKAPHSDT